MIVSIIRVSRTPLLSEHLRKHTRAGVAKPDASGLQDKECRARSSPAAGAGGHDAGRADGRQGELFVPEERGRGEAGDGRGLWLSHPVSGGGAGAGGGGVRGALWDREMRWQICRI
ncbi:MAG: hypothetical protein ACYDHX_15725 [Methanothrix sp.]